MADLSSKSVKELKELAKNANISGRSKLTKKDDLIAALNRLRVSKKSSSSSSKKSSSSGFKLTFRFEPNLSSRRSVPDVLPYMDRLTAWYRGFAIEQAEAEEGTLENIRHEGKKIIITLKFSYNINMNDKILLMRVIADPDEDGNHPIMINDREYLVNGENIEYKRGTEWIPVEDT